MIGVLPKRKILMRHEKSQGNRNTVAYISTSNHSIQSMTQGMTQALHANEHLRRLMGSDGYSSDLWV